MKIEQDVREAVEDALNKVIELIENNYKETHSVAISTNDTNQKLGNLTKWH